MNILLINQFFWPDTAPTAQLLGDLAKHLVEQGCSVTVFCGSGAYDGTAPKQLPSGLEGVRIVRIPTLAWRNSFLARLASYVMFLAASIVLGVFGSRQDLVITLTTPPLLGITGTMLKALTGARHISWEMDLYPEVGIDLGVFPPESWFIRLLLKVARLLRRRADGILALGTCMRRRLIASGLDPAKVHLTENWANGEIIYPSRARRNERFTILYSGNLGMAHDVATVQAVLDKLGNDPRFEFVFTGGGNKRPALEQHCSGSGLERVRFFPYCPISELAASLNSGDIGLVTQHPGCVGSTVPSKIYAYFAAGRPVLYIGPPETTCALTIERHRCGWRVDCGDPSGVTALLEELAANPERVSLAGRNARKAFLQYYDLPAGVGRISAALGLSGAAKTRHVSTAASR